MTANTPSTSENNGEQKLFAWIDSKGLCDLFSCEADEFKKELKRRISADKREAKIDALDHVIDIYNTLFEPNGEFRSFDSLKRKDVANLYLRIGEYIRELQAERTSHD